MSMQSADATNTPSPTDGTKGIASRRYVRKPASILAHGEPMVWLTGGALAICIVMIIGLLSLIVWNGSKTFWPGSIYKITSVDGTVLMGEEFRTEMFRPSEAVINALPQEAQQRAREMLEEQGGETKRRLIRTANYDLTGTHFTWISDIEIAEDGIETPEWAIIVERTAWGRFYGSPKSITIDGETTQGNSDQLWDQFQTHHADVRGMWDEMRDLETYDIGRINRGMEASRLRFRESQLLMKPSAPWMAAYQNLITTRNGGTAEEIAQAEDAVRLIESNGDKPSPEFLEAVKTFEAEQADGREKFEEVANRIGELRTKMTNYNITFETVNDQDKTLGLSEIVRSYPANQLSLSQKVGVYLSRWREFLLEDPREANSEGGIFPAIFGTVTMTLLMSLAVVPFGVLAALYLREYAKSGPVVSAVRIAVNNLAGVPSIVFGVFGLGFFCYGMGKWIDGGPADPWSPGIWMTGVGLLVFAVILAVSVSIMASRARRDSSWIIRKCGRIAVVIWFATVALCLLVVFNNPHFNGFYAANLPSPTFGTGGLMWASLTLALLTLPVVIVATEEALAAVPSSMRDGSYACGASKWQTIVRIVLPRAMPGIMTGMILAMARGAGEVAPLMLVGAVKLAPELPIDIHNLGGTLGPIPTGPAHLERSFMHMGFHIYDLGFQSQNSEAAKPMVFTTALVLILLITTLNLAAIFLRSRLRRKFTASGF